MRKKLWIIGGAIVVVGLIGGTIAWNYTNKPVANMTSLKTDFTLAATDLYSEFESDETAANTKYLDKVIEVKGKVFEASESENGTINVTLEGGGLLGGVMCNLETGTKHKRTQFEAGTEVTFKGVCTGMLSDVVLVRCIEVN